MRHDSNDSKAAELFRDNNFPLARIAQYPISCLESMAAELDSIYQGVCPVECLGCCANAVPPGEALGKICLLTPPLLNGILGVFEELARDDIHILSRGRLTLSSASNELNNPYSTKLRQQLSAFFQRNYDILLGALSSDIAFHVSDTKIFHQNLKNAIERPLLWDNMCFSIDEQIPFTNAEKYERYLEQLSLVWDTLKPAIRNNLDHAKPHRREGPRVIINMLIPNEPEVYNRSNSHVYAGGPPRATKYQDLIDRYIRPFVGDVVETSNNVPNGHVFTTALGRFSGIVGSSVYISASKYIRLGRAISFIHSQDSSRHIRRSGSVRTKLYPAGPSRFVIRGCLATTDVSEDKLPYESSKPPKWFGALDEFVFDVG